MTPARSNTAQVRDRAREKATGVLHGLPITAHLNHDVRRAMRVAVELRALALNLSVKAYVAGHVPRFLAPNGTPEEALELAYAIFPELGKKP